MLIMIGIGIYGRRYNTSFDESLTASKQATVIMVASAAIGAHIGSGFVLGGAEEGVRWGLAGMWYGIGCSLSYILIAILTARYLYNKGYVTLTGYFKERYEDKSTALIYSIATPLSYIAIFSGQIIAGKSIFQAIGINDTIGVIATVVIVLLYCGLSGLWGALATSVIQVTIIIISLIFGLYFLSQNDGFNMISTLPQTKFELVPFGPEKLVMLTIPTILSQLIDQANIQRIASSKNENTAQKGFLLAGIALIPLAIIPVLLGMYGSLIYPDLPENTVLMTLVLEKYPAFIAGLFMASILSAIMSTCAAMISGISATVLGDIYKGILNPKANESTMKKLNLVLYVVVGVLSIFIALKLSNIISLLSMAYTILVSGCLIPFAGGIIWNKANSKGAIASAVVGIITSLLIAFGVINPPFASLFPLIPALIAFIAGSLMTKNN